MANKFPSWIQKHKNKNVEIKKIGKNYYAYQIKSVWDKKINRARKFTVGYLGKVTQENIVPPKHKRNLKLESIKDYGNVFFVKDQLSNVVGKLKKYFPYSYESIITASVIKLCYQSSIKNISLQYHTSFLSEFYKDANTSPNKISELLSILGHNTEKINRFFHSLSTGKESIAIDLTAIFTDSENIHFAEKGYNSKKIYHDQLQFLLLYSLNKNLPTFFKVLPGSVRDVSSLINAVKESKITDAVFVSDRGFTSENNWNFFEESKLKFIFPLRKNSSLISYDQNDHKKYFTFRKKHIWYRELKYDDKRIIQYLDKKLMVEEETTFLHLVNADIKTMEEFESKKNGFGIISIITNSDFTVEKVYELYKKRNDIEVTFNAMKNTLDDDKTYMQSTGKVRGYFFITFLALYFHSKIQNLLRENDLLKKYSVADVLLHLSKVYKIRVNDQYILSEIPKQVRLIIEKLKIPIT